MRTRGKSSVVGGHGTLPGRFQQRGGRWLDDHRLVFWNGSKAFLWNTETRKSAPIGELPGPVSTSHTVQFAFSTDGKTLYVLQVNWDSALWLLEDTESIK